jgi:hypothetical protein
MAPGKSGPEGKPRIYANGINTPAQVSGFNCEAMVRMALPTSSASVEFY